MAGAASARRTRRPLSQASPLKDVILVRSRYSFPVLAGEYHNKSGPAAEQAVLTPALRMTTRPAVPGRHARPPWAGVCLPVLFQVAQAEPTRIDGRAVAVTGDDPPTILVLANLEAAPAEQLAFQAGE